MFNLSLWEILVIVILALIVVKPEDLPTIMKSIGKAMRWVKKTTKEFTSFFDDAVKDSAINEVAEDFQEIIDLEGNIQRAYDVSDLEDFADNSQSQKKAKSKIKNEALKP